MSGAKFRGRSFEGDGSGAKCQGRSVRAKCWGRNAHYYAEKRVEIGKKIGEIFQNLEPNFQHV